MKIILVTGANGQLGNEMRIVAKQSNDRYIFTDVNEVEGVETTYLDITDLDAVRKMVADNGVNVIVNCAAYTNVDKAEEDVAFCTVLKCISLQTMSSVVTPTIPLARRTNKALLRGLMVCQSCLASRQSNLMVVTMLLSAPLGSIRSLARTSAKR